MSDKRKDKKGRILKTGEYQRSDGRYEFRYVDLKGERQAVYSWRLVDTDSQPPDKKSLEPLRRQEEKIQRILSEGFDRDAAKRTLNECFDEYMETRIDLKRSTRERYKIAYNFHVRNELGDMRIGDIRYSDIKQFYTRLIADKNLSRSSLRNIDAPLVSIFKTLVRDNAIRSNPADGVLKEVARFTKAEATPKEALTAEQQASFIQFYTHSDETVCKDSVLLFTVLFGTGLRIGEALGLTWDDIDWNNNSISVNHILHRGHEDGKIVDYISSPKSKSGIRNIPMFKEVREALEDEYNRQSNAESRYCEKIDGYTNFVFLTKDNRVMKYKLVQRRISRVVQMYNEWETRRASEEKCEPLTLTNVSAHTFRHSFCSRMAEAGVDVKVLQEVMGHSDFGITMNVYTQISPKRLEKVFTSLEGKIAIS